MSKDNLQMIYHVQTKAHQRTTPLELLAVGGLELYLIFLTRQGPKTHQMKSPYLLGGPRDASSAALFRGGRLTAPTTKALFFIS